MKLLKKIAFLVEEFALQTPAQQLLDRFLIGYPRDGTFHRLADCRVAVHFRGGEENELLAKRKSDFGLDVESDVGRACATADAILVVPRGSGAVTNEDLLRAALQAAPKGCACFAHGVVANSLAGAKQLQTLAESRGVSLLAGTSLSVTWRLPEIDLPSGAPLKEALIVVQGEAPRGELDALQGLLPVLERRRGGKSGVKRVKFLAGEELWRAGKAGEWSWPLLAAALSRSDTPQGDALKDGRTQDLVGLGLVPKLARDPRGWLLEHANGLRTALLVLDGVVADANFAVLTRDGTQFSAQLYRPPAPAEHNYSRLASVLEDYFLGGARPWPASRETLVAGLLKTFREPPARAGRWCDTPDLARASRAGK